MLIISTRPPLEPGVSAAHAPRPVTSLARQACLCGHGDDVKGGMRVPPGPSFPCPGDSGTWHHGSLPELWPGKQGEELGPGERKKVGLRRQRWDCGGAHALGRADVARKAARGDMSSFQSNLSGSWVENRAQCRLRRAVGSTGTELLWKKMQTWV